MDNALEMQINEARLRDGPDRNVGIVPNPTIGLDLGKILIEQVVKGFVDTLCLARVRVRVRVRVRLG